MDTGYISAYELQQRRGLSRREVLELAATQPTFWKVPAIGKMKQRDEEPLIDWSKYTPDRRYFLDGLEYLKGWATKDWYYVASTFREAWGKEGAVPNDKLMLDYMLYPRLPEFITGKIAHQLLQLMCPAEINSNLDKIYPLCDIIRLMDRGRMLNLVTLPSECKTTYDVWLFLCDDDHAYTNPVVIDMFFERYFKENLFFKDDNTSCEQEQRQAEQEATFNSTQPIGYLCGLSRFKLC